jgi:hypothetical protein
MASPAPLSARMGEGVGVDTGARARLRSARSSRTNEERMPLRRREERQEAPTDRERVTVPPEPVAEAEEQVPEGPERAAATLGNRGFAMLAREGEGLLPDGRVHPDVEAAVAASRGRGRSLDPASRERFGRALGDDLEDVRVHDDGGAAGLARAVEARAFTVGRDVFFAEGEHRPGTGEGDRLLAHELAHAVQGRGASTAGPLTATRPGDAAERAADEGASRAAGPGVLARRVEGAEDIGLAKGTGAGTIPAGEVIVIEEAVYDLTAETVEGEIRDIITDYGHRIGALKTALSDAMSSFATDQSFAGGSEGKTDFSGTFLSFAIDTVLDKSFEFLPTGPKEAMQIGKGLLGKLREENERASKARGERSVAAFVNDHQAKVTNAFLAEIATLEDKRGQAYRRYREILASDKSARDADARVSGSKGTGRRSVFGDAASLLKSLRAQKDAIRPPASMETVLEEIVEQWVGQSAGKFRHSGGGGWYIDGRIEIGMKYDWDGGSSLSLSDKPEAKLNAPRASRVVHSLERVLKAGRTINDLDIQKVLKVKVEYEREWAQNYYYWVTFHWTKPDRIVKIERDARPLERDVWDLVPRVEQMVMSHVKLSDVAQQIGTNVEPGEEKHL